MEDQIVTIEGDSYHLRYAIDEYGEEIEILDHVNTDLDYEHFHPETMYD